MKDRAIKVEQDRATPGGGDPRRSNAWVTRLAVFVVCGGLLPGCSLSVPMSGAAPDELSTGTIKPAGLSPFSAEMDAEDWRRAKSALDTALDPQGNGASVAWDNPNSGAKGSFVPLAQPYPKEDGICRPFAAHLNVKGEAEHVVQASACRVNSGEWIVGRIVALAKTKKPAPKKSDNLADQGTSTQLKERAKAPPSAPSLGL